VSLQIGLDHLGHEVLELDRRFPLEFPPRLASVPQQEVYFRRSLQFGARHDMVVIVEADLRERNVTSPEVTVLGRVSVFFRAYSDERTRFIPPNRADSTRDAHPDRLPISSFFYVVETDG
jgi:hypothetical protein